MSKKVVIVICAVIAFFLGAIWIDYVPSIAPLVAFLEVAIGFTGGYFFGKDSLAPQVRGCQDTIQKLMEANLKLSQENNLLKTEAEKEVKKRKSKKKEEEPKGE